MRASLSDIGLVGDRRTVAVIGRDATIRWFSPYRSDQPSIFDELLSPGGAAWRVSLANAAPAGRAYLGKTAILETRIRNPDGELRVTDWMTMGRGASPGVLCRLFSAAPATTVVSLDASEEYGRRPSRIALAGGGAVLQSGMHLFASHPLRLERHRVKWTLPAGEDGWAVLADAPIDPPRLDDILAWRTATESRWQELAATTTYRGPYEDEVRASLRQLRLLVFEPTGAVVAAPTLGLPEVIGGRRNYDYRYSWLRDSAIVVRAMLQTAADTREGDAFLHFIAMSAEHANRYPLSPVIAVDGRPLAPERRLPLPGYAGSRPVRLHNRASSQLQLDGLGNFLVAAGAVYEKRGVGFAWDTVETVADFLATRWRQPDSGIWESPRRRQYTVGKVLAACGLEAVAPFASVNAARRYREAAGDVREFVYRHCLTKEGAFAAFAGCQKVDISAALFPTWRFCRADAPEMTACIRALERDDERAGLFSREDETPQSEREGAFLAGSFWMSQYWSARGDAERARRYLEAGLAHANDLGILPEEVSWATGEPLGNTPLAMAHASFLNAAADLRELKPSSGCPRAGARSSQVHVQEG